MPTKKVAAFVVKSALQPLALATIFLYFAGVTHAGGPKYVAGSSYFNSSSMGQPLIWPQGEVNYYTDQGDLSPILPNSAANALVANAFLQWTSVTTASVVANGAGQLSEDVNGSNIAVDVEGIVTAPFDITPSSTQTPVGIVYDYDGSVTDALLGVGAGGASQCFWNAVSGGIDNFGTDASLSHALVIINGQCALQSSQLTDLEYRLVRVLGGVLGLGWSQLNLNVITGRPAPTLDDYAGFPVMHYMDPVSCVPITLCYTNPYALAADDVAALSRLYPTSNSGGNRARIHGSVYFSNHQGAEGQPMQGVNVFARWIDPSTNLPSHRYAASSVSGFLFVGNAGNTITGLTDSFGNAFGEFGSDDQSLEGFFDLGDLPIPNGGTSAQYQLSVEALDPTWSTGIGPYDYSQVKPSGTFVPIVVTVSAGGDFQQDILMVGSAQPTPPWTETETWASPAPLLSPGDWVGSLSGYGDMSFFQITAQANRTLSVAVTALDETGAPTESKAEPVAGVWTSGAPEGSVPAAFTSAPFNSEVFATSRLDAQVLSSNTFIIGIADLRGDGRPDYSYHAHVLYGDTVIPSRLPVGGGTISLQGIGLAPGVNVAIGTLNVPLLGTDASQIVVAAPAQIDGTQTITISDPVSGAFSIMTGALTFGAAATDQIMLLKGGNPPTPVGVQATYPVIVKVVASDGVTAVGGATIGWTTTNGVGLSACGGASSCSVTTDESGIASAWPTPTASGVANITASLAPAVYNPAQTVSGTLNATASSLDMGVTNPFLWIAQGASVSVPVTARVLNTGVPKAGVTINFVITEGPGLLSAASAVTNSNGYASVTLTQANLSGNFQLTACVAPGNSPCQVVNGTAVSPALVNLQAVAGADQFVVGSAFQPLTVRVTDSSVPPNAVLGAVVLFQATVLRPPGQDSSLGTGDQAESPSGMPVLLSESQSSVVSDADGLASILPSVGEFTGLLEVAIQVSAGSLATLQDVLESLPQSGSGSIAQR